VAEVVHSILLTHDELAWASAHDFLVTENCGGVVIFAGTVRTPNAGEEVLHLLFEAYEPMVHEEAKRIVQEMEMRWPVVKVLLWHRLGKCIPKETVVLAGITAKHRAEAFEACSFLMNELKKRLPIWKKEVTLSGETWVSSHP
jgi:molybdopterin synthase catalytic subunit